MSKTTLMVIRLFVQKSQLHKKMEFSSSLCARLAQAYFLLGNDEIATLLRGLGKKFSYKGAGILLNAREKKEKPND
jgi:type II secretory pathway component PulJ